MFSWLLHVRRCGGLWFFDYYSSLELALAASYVLLKHQKDVQSTCITQVRYY